MTARSPRFFRRISSRPNGGWSALDTRSRDWEQAYRDRWQHDRVVRSTHGVNCTGSCSWKVHVKQGIVTWETQQTDYPENGRGRPRLRAPRLPAGGVLLLVRLLPPADPAPVRPRRAAGALPRRPGADRRPGERVGRRRGRPGGARRLHVPAREGRLRARLLGRGCRHGRGRPRAHDPPVGPGPRRRLLADPRDVHGLLLGGDALLLADGGRAHQLLRLVRGPPAGVAAGVGRPDRRAGVGRLVERELPDDVGLQHPDDAHARRALHDGGALQGPEDGRGLAGLLGPHQVRRPLARRAAGDRRGARPGDEPRDPARVPRGARDALLRRLRPALHRPAVPGQAARARGRPRARRVPHRRGSRRRRRARRGQDGHLGRGHRVAGGAERVDRLPLGRRGRRALEPRPRRRAARADADGVRGGRPRRPAALRHRRHGGRWGHAPRRPRPPRRRPPRDHGVRPARRPARRGPRRPAGALAGRARRPRAVHAGLAGGDHRRPGRARHPDRPRVRPQR